MRIGRRERQGGTPGRPERRSDSERIEAIAHDAALPVEDVLRDVAEFRLALETDMIVAAAAAEENAPELLSEIVDGERAELADFHDRLLERLVDAAAHDELAARRARRTAGSTRRAGRVVAAAAAVLALVGVSRLPGSAPDNRVALATASQQYADLSSAVAHEHSSTAVKEAAAELHETLESLITQHAGDPEVAQQAAALLQAEISLLQVQDPAGASQVIAQAKSLMTLLRQAAPPNVRASVAPILDAVTSPSPKATPKPSAKPSPTKASPTPTPKQTPKSTPKPSESASADDDSPLNTP